MKVRDLRNNPLLSCQAGPCRCKDRRYFGSDAVCETEGLRQASEPQRCRRERVSAAHQKLPGGVRHHPKQGSGSYAREVISDYHPLFYPGWVMLMRVSWPRSHLEHVHAPPRLWAGNGGGSSGSQHESPVCVPVDLFI